MQITTKSLRTHTHEIFACIERGEQVTITYRGKPKALLTSINEQNQTQTASDSSVEIPVFGIWSDREALDDIDSYLKELRKGRYDAG